MVVGDIGLVQRWDLSPSRSLYPGQGDGREGNTS